ncbi:MAG: imidazolonepropionase [Terrimesophilobacter sp.]
MPNNSSTSVDLIVTGASELLTCAGDASDLIGLVPGGGVAIADGRIVAVGDVSEYHAARVIDAQGGVVMPGFVDAHTHVVFGGSRVQEYAAKVGGLIPPSGAPVGINGTMTTTRAASSEQLLEQSSARIHDMMRQGTTTLESKSGYGLSSAHELRLLETNQRLSDTMPVDIVSTYLGAHAFPDDIPHDQWVNEIIALTPEVAERGLAEFTDAYCDEGYFNLAQTERILAAGLDVGLKPKLHLDAYSHTGAASLAIELGAVSVDHLNFTTDAELRALGDAGIPGVYMPCLDYSVAHQHPVDPRRIVNAGMELALATDICPGCWVTNMQLAVAMACRTGGLSVAQALRAATYGSALALGRHESVGSLKVGMQADVIVLDVTRHEDIAYRIGNNAVTTVIARGSVIERL